MPAAYHRHTTSTGSASSAGVSESASKSHGTQTNPVSGTRGGHVSQWAQPVNRDPGSSSHLTALTAGYETTDNELTPFSRDTTSMFEPTDVFDDETQQKVPAMAFMAQGQRNKGPIPTRKVLMFLCLAFVIFGSAYIIYKDHDREMAREAELFDRYLPPVARSSEDHTENANKPANDHQRVLVQSVKPLESPKPESPIQWLRDNTFLDISTFPTQQRQQLVATRPKAAFIALVRNSEVEEMVQSIMQLEARFNGRATHRYDWVFFNDEQFSDDFKALVANATKSHCYFETIPKEHWTIPQWIDTTRFDVGRQFMGGIGVGKAWLQSYHHMCRWNAGLFALEKRLLEYDYFWRVEPGVEFSCDINYDVFRFMSDNDLEYGFNMAILDDARSFPSLWDQTKSFLKANPDQIHDSADFEWLLQTARGLSGALSVELPSRDNLEVLDAWDYNNCQFYSNFEVGHLGFFRSAEHQAFFTHLDKAGGFYYERFGDAPVHTLSVALFMPKKHIWYFRDIGYAHGLCEQCPPHESDAVEVEQKLRGEIMEIVSLDNHHRDWRHMSMDLIKQSGIPGLSCGCTVSAIDRDNSKLVPYESKQQKPDDPCIRLFLGGKWLAKKPGWNFEDEVAAGRDGSGGYLLDGLEGNPYLPVPTGGNHRQ